MHQITFLSKTPLGSTRPPVAKQTLKGNPALSGPMFPINARVGESRPKITQGKITDGIPLGSVSKTGGKRLRGGAILRK